jgi:heme/copper-type cytochrome/quinol oxidase subunit 1
MAHNWLMLIYKGRKSVSKKLTLLKWWFTATIFNPGVTCLINDLANVDKDSAIWVVGGHGAE